MRPPENLYHQNIADDATRSSCALNRCNLSPWLISSEEFQANPLPLEIDGAKMTDRGLFGGLAKLSEPLERGRFFHEYLCAKFGLREKLLRDGKAKPVYSYLHLLRAWAVDSNGQAGAVLKSWVESRFGILATYHKGALAVDPVAREAFLREKTDGAARSIGVLMQLDLLYTYCQWELDRLHPGMKRMRLYRGTHDPQEYAVRSQGTSRAELVSRIALVQFNNLSSFTADPEVAWEFGSNAWEVEVPLAKVVCFGGLLPPSYLAGESEYLVLGGFFRVRGMIC